MGDKVTDYYHVEPPSEKDPPQYSTYERRAEVLDILIASRSPKSVNRTRLAERYDVAVSTITRDIDRLGEAVSEMFDEQSIILETRALREEVVNSLLQEDSWRAKKAALDAHFDWVRFLGYDEVLADTAEDSNEEDETRTGTSRRGEPGEHRLPENTREALDSIHEKSKKDCEPFLVEHGTSGHDNAGGEDQT